MPPTTLREAAIAMPFAGYADFDDCVDSNQDAEDPRAYCGAIQAAVEGKVLKKDVEAERATWDAAYVNSLPDSAFLYIGPGGEKDSDGKTVPRALRKFPVRNAEGAIDLPHLRNAMSRIPQADMPEAARAACERRGRALMDEYSKKALGDLLGGDTGRIVFLPDDLIAGLRAKVAATPEDSQDGDGSLGVSRLPDESMTENATSEHEATKPGRRLRGSIRDRLAALASGFADLVKWASYEDEEEDAPATKALGPGFSIFRTKDGDYRWIAVSSNGFEDREQEIVATKALEADVARKDASGDRGVLRLFHVPEADIGQCDFQDVAGRFLVESGTFDDTPLARKALDYLKSTEERLGMSIGFRYPETAFKDGVYGEIDIVERSICPWNNVANPFTAFQTLKGDASMADDAKKTWLNNVIGPDLTAEIYAKAEAGTKDLEGRVAFKGGEADAKKDDEAEAPPATLTPEQVAEAFTSAVKPLVALIERQNAVMTAVADDVKALKEADAERTEIAKKAAEAAKAEATKKGDTPRAAGAYRPTAEDSTIVEGAEKLLATDEENTSPVAQYIAQLVGRSPVGAREN